MNCCDEYGNCNQGRDCPVRGQKQPCKWCKGTTFDEHGDKCVCHPEHPGDKLAWIYGCFIAFMVLMMTIRSCST